MRRLSDAAARRLADHVFGGAGGLGSVADRPTHFEVWVHGTTGEAWRGPTPRVWEGKPVTWVFRASPR